MTPPKSYWRRSSFRSWLADGYAPPRRRIVLFLFFISCLPRPLVPKSASPALPGPFGIFRVWACSLPKPPSPVAKSIFTFRCFQLSTSTFRTIPPRPLAEVQLLALPSPTSMRYIFLHSPDLFLVVLSHSFSDSFSSRCGNAFFSSPLTLVLLKTSFSRGAEGDWGILGAQIRPCYWLAPSLTLAAGGPPPS